MIQRIHCISVQVKEYLDCLLLGQPNTEGRLGRGLLQAC